ncbi:hypothetical protein FBULB1_11572 [Fusarium bulbicola]|nr:hypothetical protein FBULB1_11572 [Fusarium bulbicola]
MPSFLNSILSSSSMILGPKDSSWREAGDAPAKIAPIYIFESIQPCGSTPTGSRLQHILKPCTARISFHSSYFSATEPINIIAITGGCPTDDPEAIIVQHARKLDQIEAPPHQVGIQFFQVGNELGAGTALFDWDNGISRHSIRDMVDTFTWDASASDGKKELTEEGILKAVPGAVVLRLDRETSGEPESGRY